MLKKRKFWIHNILATAFIFGFMWFAGQVLSIFDFLDPIGDALKGYEVTDQVFSEPKWRNRPPIEDRIVIVNIGNLPRGLIAQQLNILNHYEPRVIGMDVRFGSLKPDTLGDLMLMDALANSPNIVMYSKMLDPGDDGIWNDALYSNPLFMQDHPTAYMNLAVEDAGSQQFDFKTCRTFFPRDLLRLPSGEIDTVHALGVELANYLEPEKTKEFLDRNIEEELINFRGNIIDFGRTRHSNRFYAIDAYAVLDTVFTPDIIKDKIVLMGFMGNSIFNPEAIIEDKYFTPLNSQYTGRANPDMYGVVVHANIIAMILNGDYLDQMSELAGKLLSVLVCFLNVVVFSMIYYKIPKWYDGVTKLIQLMEALLFTFIIILVFHFFNFKLDLTWSIIVVLLAGDALEVYYGVMVNTFEKIEQKLFTKDEVVV
jgi:CHASE2 domain-containing sensor protein